MLNAPRQTAMVVPDASYRSTEYAPDVPDGFVQYREQQGIVDYGSLLVESQTVPDLLAELRPYLWRLVAGCLDDSPHLMRLLRRVAWVKEAPVFLALQPGATSLIREAAIVLAREAVLVKAGAGSQTLRGMPLEHVAVYSEAAAILRRAALAKVTGSVCGADPGYGLAPGLALVQTLLAELEPESISEDATVPASDSELAQTAHEPVQDVEAPPIIAALTAAPVFRPIVCAFVLAAVTAAPSRRPGVLPVSTGPPGTGPPRLQIVKRDRAKIPTGGRST